LHDPPSVGAGGQPQIPELRRRFADRTGQRAKLLISDVLLAAAIALYIAGWFSQWSAQLSLWVLGLAILGATWRCLAVRCPKCGAFTTWRTWVRPSFRLEKGAPVPGQELVCPACGYDPP